MIQIDVTQCHARVTITYESNEATTRTSAAPLSVQRVGHILSPRLDTFLYSTNGSYHMGTIRTNRTSRQLKGEFLVIQRVRNIVIPPNEMQFSIRQRV